MLTLYQIKGNAHIRIHYNLICFLQLKTLPSSWFCRVKLQLWFWDIVLQVPCRELTKAGYSSQFSPVRCPDIVLLALLLWRRGKWNVRLRQDISWEIQQCHQAIYLYFWVQVCKFAARYHFVPFLYIDIDLDIEHRLQCIVQGYIDLKLKYRIRQFKHLYSETFWIDLVNILTMKKLF